MKRLVLLLCLLQYAVVDARPKEAKYLDPEEGMPTPDIINWWGYPAEVHEVTTADGYVLEMHRIRHGKSRLDILNPLISIFRPSENECHSTGDSNDARIGGLFQHLGH
jgi:hypothetical protein